jgi:hypothetical protein
MGVEFIREIRRLHAKRRNRSVAREPSQVAAHQPDVTVIVVRETILEFTFDRLELDRRGIGRLLLDKPPDLGFRIPILPGLERLRRALDRVPERRRHGGVAGAALQRQQRSR